MNKKSIKTIFVLLIIMSIKVMSQTLNTNPGANNLNANLDKYVGTWKWEENNTSFIIIFKKENIILPPINKNVRADILYGFHKFVNNNSIIENSLDFSNTTYDNKKSSILAGLGREGIGNTLLGSITHLSKNGIGGGKKTVNFKIEYLNSTHIKLVSLENPQGVKLTRTGQPAYDWSISLPQDIILTKQ